MGRDTLRRLLRWLRGPEPTPEPGDMVEIRLVPVHEGPMLVAALCREGIHADGFDVYDVATKRHARFVVRVPYESVQEAESAIARLT